jgi:hypothetical protein
MKLTSRNEVLEKLIVIHLVKKFIGFLALVYTRTRHWTPV